MSTRADIVACARGYLGTRWHHQGRNRAGLDCVGLVIRVAHDLGLTGYDIDGYGRVPDGRVLRAELDQQMTRIAIEDAREADILLMRFDQHPQHLAMLTDQGIIHAHAMVRRVVEHGLDALWRARIVAAYGWKGVA